MSNEPTRSQALFFALKSNLLRIRRWLRDPNGGRRPARLPIRSKTASGPLLAESSSPLYPSGAGAEFALQAGKVQNLRVAARYLHGVELQAGELFSFWAHVPRPTVRRGFALGRELRSGCLIPSVGGGLCQLTNALYDAALQSGCEIVERHAHTRRIPGSMVAEGRDATIFWNYVDLRFRATVTCQLEVELTPGELHVRMRGVGTFNAPQAGLGAAPLVQLQTQSAPPVESCETCGVESCFRHHALASGIGNQQEGSATAWVVDAWMPEHDAYMARVRGPEDTLLMPVDGRRWKQGSYCWTVDGFGRVVSSPLFVVRRSLRMRWLQRGGGAARQKALLEMDAMLAEILRNRIPATALHVVVSQNLAPFLWANGVLAGRTFDVLMTRMPMDALQRQLDRAAERWPGTPTLADFRADPELVAAETAVLAQARHWITPHTGIAGCLRESTGPSAILLEWQMPGRGRALPRGTRLFFAGSTLSRKGARELREAIDGLDIPLSLGGPLLEGADFWRGHDAKFGGEGWLDEAEMVVLPAWVEHQPRRLLAALAAGVPVICTPACGLPPQPGLTLVPEGDVVALREAILQRGRSHTAIASMA